MADEAYSGEKLKKLDTLDEKEAIFYHRRYNRF